VKPETKVVGKPETKPETKPEVKPETKPEVKPETKPETKVVGKPETKADPAAKTDPTVSALVKKEEDKPKTTFSKVAVRNPTPPTRVDDTPKITPPQESTRSVGLKKQITTTKPETTTSSIGEKSTVEALV
jgi:hypothetical protein